MAQKIPTLRIGDVWRDPDDGETVEVVGKNKDQWLLKSIVPGGWCNFKNTGTVETTEVALFMDWFHDKPEWHKVEQLIKLYEG